MLNALCMMPGGVPFWFALRESCSSSFWHTEHSAHKTWPILCFSTNTHLIILHLIITCCTYSHHIWWTTAIPYEYSNIYSRYVSTSLSFGCKSWPRSNDKGEVTKDTWEMVIICFNWSLDQQDWTNYTRNAHGAHQHDDMYIYQ